MSFLGLDDLFRCSLVCRAWYEVTQDPSLWARVDYSVLGDAVNLASRLESGVAKPGWIVIGQNTYDEVKDYFECESLGMQSLKGKAQQVFAYRVYAEKEGAFAK